MTDKHWLPLPANLVIACFAVLSAGAVRTMLVHGPRSNLVITSSAPRGEDVASAHLVWLIL
jgi:hypothetical protein